jgi:DNA-binding transcriptional LysR family regulator
MELRQLAYFVAVAEEGHFTRAAERVLVAQPAISQQIRRLEKELGEELFHRNKRTVRLSAAGRTFLPHARATLAAAARASGAVASMRDLVIGKLAVGVFQGAPEGLAAGLLGRFRRHCPGVEVWVSEDYSASLLDRVHRGELDAALTGLPPGKPAPTGVSTIEVTTENLVAIVAPDDPLAVAGQVDLVRLRGQPLVTLSRRSSMRIEIDTACAKAGFQPRVVAEANHLRLLVELVAAGLGVSIVAPSVVPAQAGVAVLGLVRPVLSVRSVLASRDPAISPATRAFLALAQTHLAAANRPSSC